MKKIIGRLEAFIKDPTKGLPKEIFLLVSRLTPLVNVDLLIKDKRRRTLLTWRDDGYFPPGWHIPGGIIRYKETFSDRVRAVAAAELGVKVRFKAEPLAVKETILPSLNDRAHGIAFLFECSLIGSPDKKLKYVKGSPKPGQWAWHDKCPANLIAVHEMYREFI